MTDKPEHTPGLDLKDTVEQAALVLEELSKILPAVGLRGMGTIALNNAHDLRSALFKARGEEE